MYPKQSTLSRTTNRQTLSKHVFLHAINLNVFSAVWLSCGYMGWMWLKLRMKNKICGTIGTDTNTQHIDKCILAWNEPTLVLYAIKKWMYVLFSRSTSRIHAIRALLLRMRNAKKKKASAGDQARKQQKPNIHKCWICSSTYVCWCQKPSASYASLLLRVFFFSAHSHCIFFLFFAIDRNKLRYALKPYKAIGLVLYCGVTTPNQYNLCICSFHAQMIAMTRVCIM